jgi:hypothetical protein
VSGNSAGGPRRTASTRSLPVRTRRNYYGGRRGALSIRLEEERRRQIAEAEVSTEIDGTGRVWTLRRLPSSVR